MNHLLSNTAIPACQDTHAIASEGNPSRPATMANDWIVSFSKNWSEDPTSNNHVMIELAKDHHVLWLNSVATRSPKLTSARDLKTIWRKLGSFFRGPQRVRDNLWVYTPLVLPFPHSRWAAAINRRILALTLRLLRWRLGFKEFQLWSFLPNVSEYIGTLGESLAVYYCVDEWSKFNYVDGTRIADAEQQLCQKADLVFATATSLMQKRRQWNAQTHLALHGVDHAHFSQALKAETSIPADLAALPGPIIGFYGTLQDWVDLDLIEFLARAHPEWSIVLIGKVMVDTTRLNGLSNIHLLGRRPHEELPRYCKGFSVGIIPYILNERILHVNPIKLREYLSAGLPVVSVALPEAQPYAGLCSIARDYKEFEQAVANAINTDSPEARWQRNESMRNETWQQRVKELCTHVMRVRKNKCKSR